MSPSTPTDISNLALSLIGSRRINAMSEETEEAKACNLWFIPSRDALLREFQWSFATDRAVLSRLAENPASEWSAAWQLPSDFVRLIRLVGADPDNPIRSFALEANRRLLTHATTGLRIVYVSDAIPVPHWDSLFVQALSLKLAGNIAAGLKKNPTAGDPFLQKLESLALPKAQTADAREVLSGENMSPRQLASMSPLVNARFRGDGRPPHIPATPSNYP